MTYQLTEMNCETECRRAVFNPGEEWTRCVSRGYTFSEALDAWDLLVERYEAASGRMIDDEELVATILEHAPSDIKSILRDAHETVRRTYRNLRKHLMLIDRNRKKPCRYWAMHKCRYGTRCWFSHDARG